MRYRLEPSTVGHYSEVMLLGTVSLNFNFLIIYTNYLIFMLLFNVIFFHKVIEQSIFILAFRFVLGLCNSANSTHSFSNPLDSCFSLWSCLHQSFFQVFKKGISAIINLPFFNFAFYTFVTLKTWLNDFRKQRT